MLSVPTPLPDDHPSRQPHGHNRQVIERVAWELMRDRDLAGKYYEFPLDAMEDLVEATKRYCAKKGIDYGRNDQVPFNVVQTVALSVWFKFHHFKDGKGKA